jgi:hypothetical protein
MEVKRDDLLDLIVKNRKGIKLVAYFIYPTGTVGSSYIAEVEKAEVLAEKPGAKRIFELVDSLLDEAVTRLKYDRYRQKDVPNIEHPPYDNKVAVQCKVPGIDQSVYFSAYDWRYVICLEIRTERHGTPIPAEGEVVESNP